VREQTSYLTAGGSLVDAASAAGDLPLPPVRVFERPVDAAGAVDGVPRVVLFVRLTGGNGGGTRTGSVLATLESCGPGGTACAPAGSGSSGNVSQRASDTTRLAFDLSASQAPLVPGGVLRLTVSLGSTGNSSSADLLLGGATDSSVVVPQTDPAAPASGALPVVGVGLLTSAAAALRRRRSARSRR
ncbi:MAG: hypothetical protein JWN17_1169, partial [Frankiales bacterium]|nr:hypothetical protein [Frankiales bacterium]